MAESDSEQVPPVVVPAARTPTGRGGELMIRVAICAASGLVVSLGWILAGLGDGHLKTISVVIGLAAAAVLALVVGYTRAEVTKVRRELAQTEARLIATVEAACSGLRAEIRTLQPQPGAARNGKRSQPIRRGLRRRENGDSVISNDLRIFLQGRESAYEEDDEAP
ncbi:MAG: hypothetical protein HOU81_07855 [Hamadaea sp.]|uniref:hypothetical protein n=1 Tax=Hamadaea sp. TaxID=2024425 RepID=UPI00183DF301|nr:hypothetical protein [Hamadaea sp.]NUR70721.1 hypothetical protein [Hamadaea sp.]NUT21413.1 hypothetical protein [Hamadaea sp.]